MVHGVVADAAIIARLWAMRMFSGHQILTRCRIYADEFFTGHSGSAGNAGCDSAKSSAGVLCGGGNNCW